MTSASGGGVAAVPRWRAAETDVGQTLDTIDRWAAHPAFARLVDAFGGSAASAGSLTALAGFAAEHWDFRRGRERNLADAAQLSASQSERVLADAPLLGLSPSLPQKRHYDVVVMTGGMVRAGIVKPRYLRELVELGHSFDSAVFLGGFREFAGDEVEIAPLLGVAGSNEFDAMLAGMRQAFAVDDEPMRAGEGEPGRHSSWVEQSWPEMPGRPALSVLAAPSSRPLERRANTVDTYRFWAERRRQEQQRSILVITTPIYVPYQAAGAVEVFGVDYGLQVETVGVSTSASELGPLSQPFLAQHHLQELTAGIRAMISLRHRLLSAPGQKGATPLR